MSYVPPHMRNKSKSINSNNNRDDRFRRQSSNQNNDGWNDRRQQDRYENNDSRKVNQNQNYDNRRNFDQRDPARPVGRNSGTGDIRARRPQNKGRFGRYISDQARKELSTEQNQTYEEELFGVKSTQTAQGINFDEYDKIPVDVSGHDIPAAIDAFDELLQIPALLNNISLCKFNKPTPIQKYSIPTVVANRDLMACAQTGSGKTAAFLIPIIECLCGQPRPQMSRSYSQYYPRALILAPTRELAQQIQVQARKLLYCTGMRAVCIYGGTHIKEQFTELGYGVDILVATPGRLYDMIERKKMSLEFVNFLILDEADRMLDMGFEPQIRQIVEESDMNKNRRTLMYSATFPDEIQGLAQDFLTDYIFLAVGRVGSTTSLITQQLVYVDEGHKTEELMRVLPACDGKVLVFTGTKRMADSIEFTLQSQNINAITIHGDKSQEQREWALSEFREGRANVMVATDVAARGLDIPNVLWVIQYDLPGNIDDYVHRIGRTGRRGNVGTAISFTNEHNRPIFQELLRLLQEAKQEIPSWFTKMLSSRAPQRGFRNKRSKGKGTRDMRHQDRKPQQKEKKGIRKKGGFSNDAW